ncbi:MAG: metallophosphoesterase [Clostridia bacterium]|nr:metallophosphoesterase [Clostridia bacterium]
MALFTMGDLHLSLSAKKPMDVFGGAWQNYVEKILDQWHQTVGPDDVVVVLGDISWGMSLAECREDFLFIHNLPGKKYIIKGNHDYYWTTVKKMNAYLEEIGASSMSFIFNSAVEYEEDGKKVALCGTRGWFYEDKGEDKIYNRELGRLESSLKCAAPDLTRIAFLHYPPFGLGGGSSQVTDLMERYQVKSCYYGHLHGAALRGVRGETNLRGITYRLAIADYLGFRPMKIEI